MSFLPTEPPHWVRDRGCCTLTATFASLHDVVKRDVEEANALPEDVRHDATFQFEVNGQGPMPRFSVTRTRVVSGYAPQVVTVLFTQGRSEIVVESTATRPAVEPFQVIPSWNARANQCELRVKDESVELWQVSQRALERLFFDG